MQCRRMGGRLLGKRDEKKKSGAEKWEVGGRGSRYVIVVTAKCNFSPEYEPHPAVTVWTNTSKCKKVPYRPKI